MHSLQPTINLKNELFNVQSTSHLIIEHADLFTLFTMYILPEKSSDAKIANVLTNIKFNILKSDFLISFLNGLSVG